MELAPLARWSKGSNFPLVSDDFDAQIERFGASKSGSVGFRSFPGLRVRITEMDYCSSRLLQVSGTVGVARRHGALTT